MDIKLKSIWKKYKRIISSSWTKSTDIVRVAWEVVKETHAEFVGYILCDAKRISKCTLIHCTKQGITWHKVGNHNISTNNRRSQQYEIRHAGNLNKKIDSSPSLNIIVKMSCLKYAAMCAYVFVNTYVCMYEISCNSNSSCLFLSRTLCSKDARHLPTYI